MNTLHVLAKGKTGGIESLCVDIAKHSIDKSYFYFFWGGGANAELIENYAEKVQIRAFKNKNILKEFKVYKKFIETNNIECIVVHGTSPMMLIFSSFIKMIRKNIKLILYVHNDACEAFKDKKQKLAFKLAYRKCNKCLAISNFVKSQLVKSGFATQKINVIYNGVDTKKFLFSRAKQKNGIINFYFVGRLIPGKGVSLLLDALVDFPYSYRLTIIGSGPELDNLKRQASLLQLNVLFLGNQQNIAERLKEADIFVHPAVLEEGFGITLIEAMSEGIPCVAFEKGGIPEIITNNENGFLIDKTSVEALKLTMIKAADMYFNSSSKWENMRVNANKRANEFSINNYVDNLSKYINGE